MAIKNGQQDADFLPQLLLRYWGVGNELGNDEIEILMFALASENKSLGGTIHKEAVALFNQKFPSSQIQP